MWRAFFLAVGISLCILGAEAMVLHKAVLAAEKTPEKPVPTTKPREIKPPEWAPWSLLSAGAVIVLYSFTIPRRVSQ